jgi:hypothetical protein
MTKQITKISVAAALIMSIIIITGCQNDAQTGAALGAAAGAGIGQLAGGDTESTLIGTAIGGGAGYIIGNESDKRKAQTEREQIRSEINNVTVNITNSNGSISQVRLRKQGVGYVGPRGEYYSQLPTEEQLRPIYGF